MIVDSAQSGRRATVSIPARGPQRHQPGVVRELGTALRSRGGGGRQGPGAGVAGRGESLLAAVADIAELRERTHREAFFPSTPRFFPEGGGPPRPSSPPSRFAMGGGWSGALVSTCASSPRERAITVGLPGRRWGSTAAGGTWRVRGVGWGGPRAGVHGRLVEARRRRWRSGFERRWTQGRRGDWSGGALAAQIAGNAPLRFWQGQVVAQPPPRAGARPHVAEAPGAGALRSTRPRSGSG